ncbi:MAG: ABC transporter permease [Chloroflexota bacterium]
MTDVTTLTNQRRSPFGDAMRRMFSNPLTILGAMLVAIALACALFAPWISPYPANAGDLKHFYLKPPSIEHVLGTDDLGRDILSRIIYGAQVSIKVSVLAEGIGLIVGTILGLLTGFYSGSFFDSVIMRLVDILMAFPLLIIAIALIGVLGPSETNLIIALALVIWPFVTRLVRSQALSLREVEYVSAARTLGATDLRIMFRHILPNAITPIVVYGTLGIASVILSEAALSFLGLGTTEQTIPSWGKMLNESRAFMRTAPWLPFWPGLAILLTVVGFNLLGDGLRDALDVRSQ